MRAAWTSAEAYERWIGRWNRPVARQFVHWLDGPMDGAWLDVGCGTGILTEAILEIASPHQVVGVDRSEQYIDYARVRTDDSRARFVVGDAQNLDYPPETFDLSVSSLVLNFVPDPQAVLSSMACTTKAGGIVACYVWDYLEGMEIMRSFWDAASTLDPSVDTLPEVQRYSMCRPQPLSDLFVAARLERIDARQITAPALFASFDDYWLPFLGGQGSAPTYVVSLPHSRQDELRERVRMSLPIEPDGRIALSVRAWAVRGRVSASSGGV